MKRSEARELAFIIIFEHSFNGDGIDAIIENGDKAKITAETFCYKLADTAINAIETSDQVIERLSTKWKINRLPKTTLAILRLAIAEITSGEDTPYSVIANEAVELAKKYASEEDASYINGILGSFIKEQPAKA